MGRYPARVPQLRMALAQVNPVVGDVKGNADKAAVIAAVRERGFSPVDDNEADAIAILLWSIETDGGVR